MLERLYHIAEAPHDPRLSSLLTDKVSCESPGSGDGASSLQLEDEIKVVAVVAIETRGQVYRRV
jgi:hypothetical protein